jgi:DHA2 family multidrug resistance protein
VAEAITVPLSGWLTTRFGGVRVFSVSVFMFGIFLALRPFHFAGNAATDEGFSGHGGRPPDGLIANVTTAYFPERKSMQATDYGR